MNPGVVNISELQEAASPGNGRYALQQRAATNAIFGIALPRNEASLAGKNLLLPRKVSGTCWNMGARDELFRTTGGMPIRGCREEFFTAINGHSALRHSTAERLT